MFMRPTLFAALFTIASTAQAAVPGEVIAALEANAYRYAVMSPDGSSLSYLSCPMVLADLTHMSTPRHFALVAWGDNVLYEDDRGNKYPNSEIAVWDEDCTQYGVLTAAGNMMMEFPRWSPDGSMIAVLAAEYEFGYPIRRGIYLADVVYTGNRPTGVSNLRYLIDSSGGFDWSPDSGRLVHNHNNDLYVYTLATGGSVNITNTPGRAEGLPAWSSTGRIAYSRLTASTRSGDRSDIYSVPEWGGPEVQVTSKSSVSSMRNLQPAYSPDGRYLVFSSCSSLYLMKGAVGDCVLYRIRADGSGKAVKVVGGKGQDWHLANWRR